MSEIKTLHAKLIKRQPTEELERKALKAIRKSRIWTKEEIDYGKRLGSEMYECLKDNMVDLPPEYNREIDKNFWNLV